MTSGRRSTLFLKHVLRMEEYGLCDPAEVEHLTFQVAPSPAK